MPKIKNKIPSIKTAAECTQAQMHGSWVTVDSAPDWRFKLCRVGTYDYHKEIKQITMSIYGMSSSDFNQDQITAMWLAENGVTDWKSPDDEFKFSIENARNLFCNKEYWHSINKELINAGLSYENYLKIKVEADAEAIKKP